ncbi:sulfite exporter TauE/SafE family protein [Fulvivirga aurantia]|uniref:sulfite exporter TauE/SafE family protein n=1 Tax=Fulvivirga aurantia TaxID=2529383 RepID=UPI0016272813|nr:sulfite exporter TauE/SafE family protein [Fulvivirga aurantia]
MYFLLFLAGLFGGFVAGLAGIGTGFLLIVIIPFGLQALGIPADEMVKFTIANTIFATMCSSFMNNLTTISKGKFYGNESVWAAGAAVVTAALLLQFAVLRIDYPKEIYNAIIISFLIYVVIRSIIKLKRPEESLEKITNSKLAITGATGGLVAAFTGLGGGSVVMPLLSLWLKIDIRKAKAITYAIIFAIAFVLTIVNVSNQPAFAPGVAHMGYIILPIALPLAAGVILASPFGVLLSHRVKPQIISYAFISIIILVIARKSIELFL